MSLEESWGTFLFSVDKVTEAREAVRRCNVALATMPLTHDERMAIVFHWKQIPARKETFYIYAQNLPERYRRALEPSNG